MENNIPKYKEALTQEMNLLETELKTVGRVNPDNPNDWQATPAKMSIDNADSSEVADGIEEFEENTAILKQLEIRFNEVKTALQRIEDGAFGLCDQCGKEIEEGRLNANPAATTCMEHIA